MGLDKKFLNLGVENSPGQEVRKNRPEIIFNKSLPFEKENYTLVDFSHGDVDAFKPIPSSIDQFVEGFHIGNKRAYTEYRGDYSIREEIAYKLSNFTNKIINVDEELIITPGTQGALFLAMGSIISNGDKVAVVEPDYFAFRKIIDFFDGVKVPIKMNYLKNKNCTGLDFKQLENAFKSGAKIFVFSNPNNPVGVVYSRSEIKRIALLAKVYGVKVIVDSLYSRQIFEKKKYIHLCTQDNMHPDNILTIMGPSKTESLSGFRVGVAFGSPKIIERMEKLQAIVSLRAGGYNQSILKSWFSEPKGWLEKRTEEHQKIRDVIVNKLCKNGFEVRKAEGGSYLFPRLPELDIPIHEFINVLRLKANVVVTPGTEFGDTFEDSFRINFSQDYTESIKAIDRIIQITEVYSVG